MKNLKTLFITARLRPTTTTTLENQAIENECTVIDILYINVVWHLSNRGSQYNKRKEKEEEEELALFEK